MVTNVVNTQDSQEQAPCATLRGFRGGARRPGRSGARMVKVAVFVSTTKMDTDDLLHNPRPTTRPEVVGRRSRTRLRAGREEQMRQSVLQPAD
eukprot:8865202-Pyramimonas_sp.AAC.2